MTKTQRLHLIAQLAMSGAATGPRRSDRLRSPGNPDLSQPDLAQDASPANPLETSYLTRLVD
jgi:hypothetical protein